MEPIDYTEKMAAESLLELRAAYDALHERAYKFVTLAMGAAGGLSAYALGRVGSDNWKWLAFPLGAVALLLFAVAGYALIVGASTKHMWAGSTAKKIQERIKERSPVVEGARDEGEGVRLTRWDQTASIDEQITLYSEGAIKRGRAVDRAYKFAVFGSPAAIALGLAVAWFAR